MELRPTSHPSAESLRALALGKLDDNTAAAVLSHLDVCPECSKEVTAATNDDLLNQRRQVHQPSGTPAPAQPLAKGAAGPQPGAVPTTPWTVPPELANHPQYEVLRELGRGGMGVVYLAKNKLMDRLEVLKVLNKDLLNYPGAVERFLREIRSAAKLSHPNVVPAYSALQLGELMVFAMEYIDGEDLHALVKSRGPLPVVHACQYVQQAAIGLQHAFEKGMVHRDIKPQNLILAREGKRHIVKVLDFGLAKTMREKTEETGLTGEGQMMGTPDFMAPEQSLDAAKADIRADIYSLGCTLYYLLTGAPPFTGKSLAAVLLAHQSTEAQPLNVVRPEVPEELAAVVRKMMAKAPAERYQTPAEVVMALGVAGKQAAKGMPPKSSPDAATPAAKGRTEEEKRLLRAETIIPLAAAAPATMLGSEPASPEAEDARNTSDSKPAKARRTRGGGRKRRVPSAWKKWLIGGGIGLFLVALLGLVASGVFKGKTKDGAIVLEDVPAERRAVRNAAGAWRREGEELVQMTRGTDVRLCLGDPKWTDYDFTFEEKHPPVPCAVGALVRSPNIKRGLMLTIDWGWRTYNIHFLKENASPIIENGRWRLDNREWHEFSFKVRGQHLQCWHDKVQVVDRIVPEMPREGAVGFRTWGVPVRFRNIKVHDPDGKVLWEGMPEIGAAGK